MNATARFVLPPELVERAKRIAQDLARRSCDLQDGIDALERRGPAGFYHPAEDLVLILRDVDGDYPGGERPANDASALADEIEAAIEEAEDAAYEEGEENARTAAGEDDP